MICPLCQEWIQPYADRAANQLHCPDCSGSFAHHFMPLFIVTGPSGAGKTSLVQPLQHLLPDWDVFETDILWDSGSSWATSHCNWLRIANSIAQRPQPRPVILCSTILPEGLRDCAERELFLCIHWLALTCDDDTLAAKLRARPAWRGCDEDFIAEHLRFNAWFRNSADAVFDPPLTVLDTTLASPVATATAVRDWALERIV